MTIRRITSVAAVLAGLALPAVAQHPDTTKGQDRQSVIVGLQIDGKRILVEMDGDDVKATADGKDLPADRIEKRDGTLIVKDAESNPVARIRVGPNAGHVYRIARSDKAAIGIELQPLSRALADHLELDPNEVIYVTKAPEGRAAARGGVRDHDVITEIDGVKPVSERVLRDILAGKKPGDELKVRVLRRGKALDLTIQCERARMPTGLPYQYVLDPRSGQPDFVVAPQFPRAPNLDPAVRSLDLLQRSMSRDRLYDKYRRQLEDARENLRKAQRELRSNLRDPNLFDYFLFDEARGKAVPPRGRPDQQFFRTRMGKQGKDDVLVFPAPLPPTGATSKRGLPGGAAEEAEDHRDLERRLERLEKLLEKLVDKGKNKQSH